MLTRGAPSVAKRAPSSWVWLRQIAIRDRSALAVRGQRSQPRNERSDMRPLTRMSGISRSSSARIMLGQISDSATTARFGCQWSRKRAIQRGASRGMY